MDFKTKEFESLGLFDAILKFNSSEEVERFFTDLCTPKEIQDLKERWKVCQLLYSGKFSYRKIREITGSSTTTITRVARFLNEEPYQGYRRLLEKLNKEKENV
ncbi:MAG: transcriptional regulator [Holosporales bacterium]|jgi:TrpR-related protein YerC/YecD|nr:transcriptional regulator [Holosporales bacterium]